MTFPRYPKYKESGMEWLGEVPEHWEVIYLQSVSVEASMITIDIRKARAQLSRLVEQAARGEAFIIARSGKQMVKVIPLRRPKKSIVCRLGFMAGEITVPNDFDQMGRGDIANMFLGRDER